MCNYNLQFLFKTAIEIVPNFVVATKKRYAFSSLERFYDDNFNVWFA